MSFYLYLCRMQDQEPSTEENLMWENKQLREELRQERGWREELKEEVQEAKIKIQGLEQRIDAGERVFAHREDQARRKERSKFGGYSRPEDSKIFARGKEFVCGWTKCTSTSRTLAEARRHIRRFHLQGPQFLCEICGKLWFQRANMMAHQPGCKAKQEKIWEERQLKET